MKRLYLYTLLFLFSLSSFAQKIRFTDPGNFWKVKETYNIGSQVYYDFYDYWYGTDTLISSTTYKKMLCSDSSRAYIREDTNAGLVYYCDPTNGYEDTLYNYHLLGGGDIVYNIGSLNINDVKSTYIDSVLINGLYYKKYIIQCNNCNVYSFYRSYTMIDAIGSISGPVFPLSVGACTSGSSAYDYELLCFSQNGIAPVFNAFVYSCNGSFTLQNGGSCVASGVNPLKNSFDKWQEYPNPVVDELVIEAGSQVEVVTIYNILGQAVYKGVAVQGKNIVDVRVFCRGVYFVELMREDGSKEVKRIVKE